MLFLSVQLNTKARFVAFSTDLVYQKATFAFDGSEWTRGPDLPVTSRRCQAFPLDEDRWFFHPGLMDSDNSRGTNEQLFRELSILFSHHRSLVTKAHYVFDWRTEEWTRTADPVVQRLHHVGAVLE